MILLIPEGAVLPFYVGQQVLAPFQNVHFVHEEEGEAMKQLR